MIRNTLSFKIDHFTEFKTQMLNWANQFNICVLLDNHQYNFKHQQIECLLAVNVVSSFTLKENDPSHSLKKYEASTNDWLFGHVSYEYNAVENTSTAKADPINFPDVFFFRPETVIQLQPGLATISCIEKDPATIFQSILNSASEITNSQTQYPVVKPKISKPDYLAIINKLKQHILRGDCYEINFCQEFFAENTTIDATYIYEQLSKVSPNPFSCYYKLNDKFLLCASPERYLKKTGSTIISQPIKGTNKRNVLNEALDDDLKNELYHSKKDRSENVMVVDLVRNDFSKICKEGSVKVDELFGIYSFPQVHQMISTISGELADDVDFVDVLQATFPMGSMTGAPKKRVMELIALYEQSKRGIYSGCVGYITPEKDYDFNVVIRSIMYNATNKYLSYQVGGGITFYSDAEKEYEECLVKAAAIKKVLQKK